MAETAGRERNLWQVCGRRVARKPGSVLVKGRQVVVGEQTTRPERGIESARRMSFGQHGIIAVLHHGVKQRHQMSRHERLPPI